MKKVCFLLLASLVCLTSCGEEQVKQEEDFVLKLVDKYHDEYTIGLPIDTGYFFYCSLRNEGTITVTYKGFGSAMKTETVIGTTFWPKIVGPHTFTYTVRDKSISKVIEVYNQKPTINIDTYAYCCGPEEKIYMNDILNVISISYSPEDVDIEIEKVERADVSFSMDQSEKVYTDVEFDKVNFKWFDGTKEGFYKVHVNAVNGNRKAPGVINVVVCTAEHAGNENVLKLDGVYASKNVIIDPTNPNRFILPASRYKTDCAYVTLDGKIQNNEKIKVRFKGKAMPSMGIYAMPGGNNSFAPQSLSDGYLFSLQNPHTDRYSVYYKNFECKTAYTSQYYFGIDDLDDNKYYELEYDFETVNNNPCKDPGKEYLTNLHVIRFKVSEILNYGTSSEKVSEEPLFDLGGAGGWWDEHEISTGYATFYASELQDIVFDVFKA